MIVDLSIEKFWYNASILLSDVLDMVVKFCI